MSVTVLFTVIGAGQQYNTNRREVFLPADGTQERYSIDTYSLQ